MEDSKNAHLILLFLSGAVMVLVGLDLASDYASGGSGSHLLLEGMLLAISGTFFVVAVKRLLHANKEIQLLKGDVEAFSREKETWREETRQLLAGLSVKIEKQFAHWMLTQAETEVGFLLLKGFSLKEIADIRKTQVKTVQQQSQSIYQKTGLASRSQLAAFFLEDLLPPRD
ncbi:MAG: response regulator transcription factor [Nitrospinaceae bacterium]|nr:MAG: response regulator transcription factor [Nitrospinaceae bacterium]